MVGLPVTATVPHRTGSSVFLFPSLGPWGCVWVLARGRAAVFSLGRFWQTACPPPLPWASLHCPLSSSLPCFQPLDLCNPARTLLLSEELLLYEGRNKATQVRRHACSLQAVLGRPLYPALFSPLMVLEFYNLTTLLTPTCTPCSPH